MACILIVEDSPTQQESIKRAMEKMGHKAICVNDGSEAFDAALQHQPDLILMDVIMPHTNGFQATRILTKDERTKHIPVVMVTSKSEKSDQAWGKRQGASAYVIKPFDANALGELVENILQNHSVADKT